MVVARCAADKGGDCLAPDSKRHRTQCNCGHCVFQCDDEIVSISRRNDTDHAGSLFRKLDAPSPM